MTATKIDAIELVLAGRQYTGWQSWSVERGLESVAGRFELSVIQPLDNAFPDDIEPGAELVLSLGSDRLITGYIDERQFQLAAQSVSMTITGRDKTADLLDCAVVHRSGQFSKSTLAALAAEIAAPFGVTVVNRLSDDKPLPRINLEQGETAISLLERAARSKNALLTSDGSGALVLQQSEAWPSAGSIHIRDVLQVSRSDDHKDRFSQYLVVGQNPSMDDDDSEPTERAQARAVTSDGEITRYRPFVVISEEHNTELARRATWEMRVRRARSMTWTITLPGHRNRAGLLWQPGQLLSIDSPQNWVPDELLIVNVEWSLNPQNGATTELELMLPDAYLPEPIQIKSDSGDDDEGDDE